MEDNKSGVMHPFTLILGGELMYKPELPFEMIGGAQNREVLKLFNNDKRTKFYQRAIVFERKAYSL